MAQNLKINILAHDKTKQAFNGVRGSLSKLKSAVFSVQGALVGIGAGIGVKSIISTGKSIEDLNVRLKQLFGSAQEGAKAFDVMAKFASKVPFSLEQIQQASGNLAVVAGDANRLSEILEITGNVASVTGLDFATTAEQIQRSFSAGIASADIFRERGVRDMLGFKAGATVSAEETIKAFEKVFGRGGRFGKATDELANTFTGTLSMLGDSFFNFKKRIADKQFFDALKKEFSDLDKFIKQNEATFNDIADAIGATLAGAIKFLSTSIKAIATAVDFVTVAYEDLIKTLNKLPFVEIDIKTKAQRQTEREIGEIERERFERMSNILKVNEKLAIQAQIQKNLQEKNMKIFSISNRENFEIANSIKTQKTVLEELNEKISEQNQKFSLSAEIFATMTSTVSSFSRGIAESIVLGKSMADTFKQIAQRLLIEIIAKTIERIALLMIEKFIIDKLIKQEDNRLTTEKKITREKQKQVALQTILVALGGGGGGFFSSFFGKASGGAVSKGQPELVGERGPELFIPNSTGQITQSARGTGGGAVNVNFNINTVDASGFEDLLFRSRGTITQLINSAVNERGRESLI
jgi:hypothetical protein